VAGPPSGLRHQAGPRPGGPRRPDHQADFDTKRDRVRAALAALFDVGGWPDLLATCEITRPAAQQLLAVLPQGYQVAVPTLPGVGDRAFQVAVFYRGGWGVTPEPLLIPTELEDVAEGTRPMVPLRLAVRGHVIRFIACHWTGFDTDTSQIARERLADAVRRDCFTFLRPAVPTPGVRRHVVVVGDLNDEPSARVFGRGRLEGYRDRASSGIRHHSYAQSRRVRLYNAAWRMLGERTPHTGGATPTQVIAGTYFKPPDQWRTFDHVLVSEGLLGTTPPYLDESRTRVVSADILVAARGRPTPFTPDPPRGVSDHLPILGTLVLPAE
jgi:hypothetical protein